MSVVTQTRCDRCGTTQSGLWLSGWMTVTVKHRYLGGEEREWHMCKACVEAIPYGSIGKAVNDVIVACGEVTP